MSNILSSAAVLAPQFVPQNLPHALGFRPQFYDTEEDAMSIAEDFGDVSVIHRAPVRSAISEQAADESAESGEEDGADDGEVEVLDPQCKYCYNEGVVGVPGRGGREQIFELRCNCRDFDLSYTHLDCFLKDRQAWAERNHDHTFTEGGDWTICNECRAHFRSETALSFVLAAVSDG